MGTMIGIPLLPLKVLPHHIATRISVTPFFSAASPFMRYFRVGGHDVVLNLQQVLPYISF